MKKTIAVPTTISSVTVEQYQRFASLNDDELHDPIQVIAALAGCSISDVNQFKVDDLQKSVDAISNVLAATNELTGYPLIDTHEIAGVKYGFEPKLDEITIGMLADLTDAFSRPETWHKVLAILYRPIIRETKHLGGLYAIEPHRLDMNYQQRQELFKKAPVSLFFGVRGFFLRGMTGLESYTTSFILRQGAALAQQ
jgi:hypothetical protein